MTFIPQFWYPLGMLALEYLEKKETGPDLPLSDNPMEERSCLWLKRCRLVPHDIHSGWRICKVIGVEHRYGTC